MDRAAEGLSCCRIDFGGRDARLEACGRQEHSVVHAERLVEIFTGVIVQHFSAQPVDDFGEQDEIDIAIDEAQAGRTGGLIDERAGDAGLVAAPGGFQIEIGPEPGKMRHEIANGDVAVAPWNSGR